MERKAEIVEDEKGKLVVIHDIRFRGKRKVNWKEVEKYLREYVGQYYEIAESAEKIYIGNDFPDEFTSSIYTRTLRGAVANTKAKISSGIPELIQIASNGRWKEDFENKHKQKAAKGWYRFNTRFSVPVAKDDGSISHFNTYRAVLIVRYAADGKLYLYDVQNIKKD